MTDSTQGSSCIAFLALAMWMVSCSGDGDSDKTPKDGTRSSTGGAGGNSSGGTTFTVSGGTLSGSGGMVFSGGTPIDGSGGAMAFGGTNPSGGGASAGGRTGTGGNLNHVIGGTSAGGAGTGGVTAGGAISTGGGGSQAGGASTAAGVTTGGVTASGGSTSGSGKGVVGRPTGFAILNGNTTGGLAGQVVTATSYTQLKSYAESGTPYVILVEGTISNGSGGGKIGIQSNKSLVGVGSTAFLDGVGLEVRNSNNVIIQNLKITLVGTSNPTSVNGGDAIVINGTSKNVWIDHCELYSENPTVQKNIDKYDGLIDIRDQTGFITVSWNYIHDHHKGCLVGSSETDLYDDRKITYHHNYFLRIIKRMPMYRGSVGHFFNNYISGTSTTEATFVLMDTCLRVEKNVYETVKYAIYTGDFKGKAERIDNLENQSRPYPASCVANIPYDYSSVLIAKTADVKGIVTVGAGVGKI